MNTKKQTWLCANLLKRKNQGLILGALLLQSGLSANANVITSTTTGGNWSASATWVGNVAPNTNDDVVIATTGVNKVTFDTTTNVNSVTVNSGAILGLLSDNTTGRALTINSGFTNNGSIALGTGAGTSPTATIAFNGNSCFWTGSADMSGVKTKVLLNANGVLDISGLTTAVKFRSSGTVAFTLNANSTLIAGSQVLNANGNTSSTFTNLAGSTIKTANVNGLINGSTGMLNGFSVNGLNANATYVFSGTSAQATTGLPANVNALTISNAAGVSLSAAATVTNLSLASGVLTTSSGATPTIPATGSITGNSFVSGPLAMVYTGTGSKTFPIGKGGNGRALSLNYTALTGTSTVTAEQFETAMGGTAPASTSLYTSRYWTISQSGGSGFSYNLGLNGTGFSPVGAGVILQQGSPDTSYAATFSSPIYTATGISSMGNFAIGDYVAGADQIAFTTSPQTSVAGVASGTITVQLQDNSSNPKTYATNYTVNLSTVSGTGVFRDTGDTTTITSVTILAGNNSASFSYKDTTAGSSVITASGSGVANINQTETTTVASASKLVFFTQPANSLFGTPMPAVVVQIQDAYGNNVPQSGTAVSLVLNGASFASGTTSLNSDANGKASFNDLIINTIINGLNLTASSSGLSPATSGNFNVTVTTIVKAKNTNAMNTALSWTGGVVPGPGNYVVIDDTSVGSSSSQKNADIGASTSWYGFILNGYSASSSYTINDFSGTNVITLGPGGLNMGATNATHNFTFNPGIALGANQTWNWSYDVASGGKTLAFDAPINLNGNSLTVIGTGSIVVSNAITGNGSLTQNSTAANLALYGANTYTGSTVVSSGTLQVNGSLAAGNSVGVAGGTLSGNGTINGPVTVTNGTLRPGLGGTDTSSTLTVNSNLTLAAGVLFYLNNANPQTAAKLSVANTLALGGTLGFVNVGSALQVGDSFTLFQAGAYTGSFSNISTSVLSAGQGWDISNLAVNGTIKVITLPTITSLTPLNPVVECGSGATFTAVASGSGALSYQWSTNGNAVAGETNAAFSVASVHLPGPLTVSVTVTSPFGSVSSNSVVTIVDTTAPGAYLTATSVNLSMGTNCSAILPDYTGMVIANDACSSTINIHQSPASGTVLGSGLTVVSFSVDDGNGNTNGNVALSVNVIDTAAPVIVSQPQGLTNNIGSTANFSVGATSCSALNYQWYKGTNLLSGKTNSTFSIASVAAADAGNYHVVVSSVGGSTTSADALLTVPFIAPTIVSQQLLGNGEFQMSFSAASGQTYQVLGSEDASSALSTWSVVDTGTFGSTNAIYTETNMAGHAQRFYTIKSP